MINALVRSQCICFGKLVRELDCMRAPLGVAAITAKLVSFLTKVYVFDTKLSPFRKWQCNRLDSELEDSLRESLQVNSKVSSFTEIEYQFLCQYS